ncbi:hypothetical protein lerEdw1_017954 [Lerista edwardsae]|nr:hypothetical protein lerEdw1_017954 [Lerista edwardsae]
MARSFSLADCEVIGFDLDHTLCRYNLVETARLIYESFAQYMVTQKGYDKELLNVSPESWDFCCKGLVLDMEDGNFLKLAEDGTVLRASHGTKQMSSEEILETYGRKEWRHFKTMSGMVSRSAKYYAYDNYFDLPGALVCARIVDFLNQQSSRQKYDFWKDMIAAIQHNYKTSAFKGPDLLGALLAQEDQVDLEGLAIQALQCGLLGLGVQGVPWVHPNPLQQRLLDLAILVRLYPLYCQGILEFQADQLGLWYQGPCSQVVQLVPVPHEHQLGLAHLLLLEYQGNLLVLCSPSFLVTQVFQILGDLKVQSSLRGQEVLLLQEFLVILVVHLVQVFLFLALQVPQEHLGDLGHQLVLVCLVNLGRL